MADYIRFGERLCALRTRAKLSQEALAEKLGVSKQAVQKWETGICLPSTENLTAIAEYWNVSVDYLLLGDDRRSMEQRRTDTRPLPAYERQHPWEAYYKELPTEYRQCVDEGRDIQLYEELFGAVSRLPDGKVKSALGDLLYTITEELPMAEGYQYTEPSDYESIIQESAPLAYDYPTLTEAQMLDKLRGAWYGRICGCLLGKPLEGEWKPKLMPFLQATDNWPLHRYTTLEDASQPGLPDIATSIRRRSFPAGVLDGMPVDDDTNYIVLGYSILKKYGRDFQPRDVAQIWMELQPKRAYCTAERVAFRNFVNGYEPPESARYQNPYREWIGAQIRGDFFGWINPADPKTAAEYAWRDACISHVKNGIYGEMYISAMLAAAGGGAPIPDAVRIGISHVPTRSRLYQAVQNVIAAHERGDTVESFFEDFHRRWNGSDAYDWLHTISNAEIVTAALLWGGGDYGRSICLAVQEGFDTDCNGATVGSVAGIACGLSAIPDEWTARISGTLFTTIFGYEKVSIDRMAEETMRFLR